MFRESLLLFPTSLAMQLEASNPCLYLLHSVRSYLQIVILTTNSVGKSISEIVSFADCEIQRQYVWTSTGVLTVVMKSDSCKVLLLLSWIVEFALLYRLIYSLFGKCENLEYSFLHLLNDDWVHWCDDRIECCCGTVCLYIRLLVVGHKCDLQRPTIGTFP